MSQPAVQTMWTVSLCLSALGLFLCLAVSGVLTGSIARPVQTLDEAMEKVKKGDLSIRIHPQSNDEMGRLTRSFNQMTEDLGRYLEDKVQRQKDLNETTLKLYQTQLNPHFLYNTLDTIKWEARIRQVPRIAVLAENLAIILRKSISSKPFIPLREELETIDSYVEVQKIRFTGRFLCEKEIPDQLEECLVPKMILQPLVENAIIHGLEGCENGYICIYAGREGDVLNISITDDGRGMSPEILAWINSPEPEKREGHLGLYNIMRILKLYYGNEYGLKAERRGTMYKVVVVEDEEIARKGIIFTINWDALNCMIAGEAANGEEGAEVIRRLSPDIIVTDLKMPRMDGVEMIAKLREQGNRAKFIILTAYGDFKYAQSAVKLGVSDYLLKPLKDGDLEQAVTRIIDQLEEGDRLRQKEEEETPIFRFNADRKAKNKYVEQAIKQIREHYKEDINISTVAEQLQISEGYLSRVFKKETDYTFTTYLSYYRMKVAMELLKEGNLKVYEVADAAGYSDTAYFSAQFKKIVGIAPSEYQDRVRGH